MTSRSHYALPCRGTSRSSTRCTRAPSSYYFEIFGSQDEERRSNLRTALRTQESRFPRILLISHFAGMQGEFANTLVIGMGTDGASRVKEVE